MTLKTFHDYFESTIKDGRKPSMIELDADTYDWLCQHYYVLPRLAAGFEPEFLFRGVPVCIGPSGVDLPRAIYGH